MRTACLQRSSCARSVAQRQAHGARTLATSRVMRPYPTPQYRMIARSSEETSSDASTSESGPIMRLKEIWASLEVDSPDLENALADVDAELADLKDRLAAADQRIVSLEGTTQSAKEQMLRLTADFDNFRKRTANEKDALAVSAKGDVVTQLLPLVDNFELARNQVKAETEGEQKINNAYQGLYKQMVDLLRSLGVEPVDTTGSPFDPEMHDAIMREPSEEVPDGTVLQEFRKGFKMGDRLLRPAMVKVSFSDAPAPPPAGDESADATEEVAA